MNNQTDKHCDKLDYIKALGVKIELNQSHHKCDDDIGSRIISCKINIKTPTQETYYSKLSIQYQSFEINLETSQNILINKNLFNKTKYLIFIIYMKKKLAIRL